MAFNRGYSRKQVSRCGFVCELAMDYHHRRSAEWVPQESAGVGTSMAVLPSSKIYPQTTGMIPRYTGHVPGEHFKIGYTFGKATVNAKRWLDEFT